jgi:hypothetical protein
MTSILLQRHLGRSALAEYLARPAPATIVVPGEPACRIVFDTSRREMVLRTPTNAQASFDVVGYENVKTRVVISEGEAWSEIAISYGDNGHEAYLVLSDVADMIQQNRISFNAAVEAALRTFRDLLSRAGALSPERQIGLCGELLFLESCLKTMPAEAAITGWMGASANEHDFAFPAVCFEIKTTETERRRHKISSLEQLEPLPDAALWLVSVQLTSAGWGSGRTLAEVVGSVRAAAGPLREALDLKLARVGWRDCDAALYHERKALRAKPAAYLVDGDFPVLSRRIVRERCARPGLIVDASYTIDVSSLEHGEPPAPADRFVQGDA